MIKITKILRIAKLIILFSALLFAFSTAAQVGIGTTTPASGALLDLNDPNRGLLVPRVSINNLGTAAPVTAPTTGLLVWNTRIPTGIGFHYWDGADWIPLGGKPGWDLSGNALAGGEFLGTTSTDALDIRSDNVERMRIQDDGQVTVNFGAGLSGAGDQFAAFGPFAVNGYTTNGFGVYGQAQAGGIGVYGFASDTFGVFGDVTTGSGVFGLATSGEGVRGEAGSGIASLGISTSNSGVQGQSTTAAGVVGFGSTYGTLGIVTGGVGAQGQATTGDGVRGFSTSAEGVYGQSTSGIGVWGRSSNNTGYGGYFFNSGTLSHGVVATGNNGTAIIIPGTGAGATASGEFIGSLGYANNGNSNGVIGTANGNLTFFTNPYGNGSGVAGTGDDMGVYGYGAFTNSIGVMGDGGTVAGGEGVDGLGYIGVAGYTTNVIFGYGVYSFGDLGTTGNTYATGIKFFRMDHPLDPANKYLRHASIESNEILNLYRGKEIFDANGKAIVELPDYFDAINKNASYQLTPIGAAMPNLFIEKEIENGTFVIAGGVAGKKVSWQLTAERNDPYLQQNPEHRVMEVDKGNERGTYLTPELYGVSDELSTRIRNRSRSSQRKTTDASNSHAIKELEINNKKDNLKSEVLDPQEILENTHERNSKDSNPFTKNIKVNFNKE